MKKHVLLSALCLFAIASGAQEPAAEIAPESAPPDTALEQGTLPAEHELDVDNEDSDDGEAFREIVSVGHDATLAEGHKAVSVVAVFGSATSAGEVADQVVAVFGNARVTGPVGDGTVAVFGNNYVNSRVGGDVVAVLGNVELGPQAVIGGRVVAVGGNFKRDPAAVVRGDVEHVMGGISEHFAWLHPWFNECVRYARLLAFAPGLGWAWGVALGFLALYMLLALLFGSGVDRCARTLETQPGRSILTAFLTVLLAPVLLVLLCITVIGIAVVPFLLLGLFIAGLFGRAVMLAWLGRRVTQFFENSRLAHPAVAVLAGGVIVLALYLVPVLGFVVYNVIGILGLGVVIYTLILGAQRDRAPVTSTAEAAATIPATAVAGQPQSQIEPEASAPLAVDMDTANRAGFWIRMAALFLDVVLIGIILAFLHNAGKLELLALAVYGAIMWKLKGSTVGGIICGLKVVRLDGRPVDWPTAVVRALGCFLSLAIAGLGFLWIVFDEGKQAWHDKIAGTAVVRSPKGASLV